MEVKYKLTPPSRERSFHHLVPVYLPTLLCYIICYIIYYVTFSPNNIKYFPCVIILLYSCVFLLIHMKYTILFLQLLGLHLF